MTAQSKNRPLPIELLGDKKLANFGITETAGEDGVTYNYYQITFHSSFEDEEVIKGVLKQTENVLQFILDTKARELGWDDMKSARAGNVPIKPTDSQEVIAMKNEADSLTDWYYAVWSTAVRIKQEAESGLTQITSIDDILNQIPKYVG